MLSRSGDYPTHPTIAEFEDAFAAYCGARDAVALNSGASALHPRHAGGRHRTGRRGDDGSAAFVATVAAIIHTGAKPVFVDIDPANLDDGPISDRAGPDLGNQGHRPGAPARPPRGHGPDLCRLRAATGSG